MNLKNQFLIAMPSMADERFKQTVVYICEHNEEGAMGLVLNRPLDITITKMLNQIEIERELPITKPLSIEYPVLCGGPVADDRGFVLHQDNHAYGSSIHVADNLTITTSKDVLALLGTEQAPQRYLVALGYAGWSAGQLEQEILENAWLTMEADPKIIFYTPLQMRWNKALLLLGITPAKLSYGFGRA